jgi:hypothetical protein
LNKLCISEDIESYSQSCDTSARILTDAIIKHEQYNVNLGYSKYKTDIAIIKLKWIPRKSILIQSINLPNEDECTKTQEGNILTFTAFGKSKR